MIHHVAGKTQMTEPRNSSENPVSDAGKYIPLFRVFMPATVFAPLREALFSGHISQGPRVNDFAITESTRTVIWGI